MAKTLEEIRKKLQALNPQQSNKSKDKTLYPHWDIAEGTSAIVRFMPDGNEDNVFFWVERQLFKLPFPGIKGHEENKPVVVQVPCIEMWTGKNTCPILNEVRPWWKDESLKPLASKYWTKKTYYMQGFVKSDPMGEEDAPENPIRKFVIGPQIFALIKAALLDPEMESSPVDFINGTDFIISKTSKGGYADYATSKWARKESSITEDMQNDIDTFGLVDLSTYLPAKPTPEHVAAYFDMFQASLDGELYDPARWANFYKPFGFDSATGSGDEEGDQPRTPSRATSRPTPPVKASVIEEKAPVAEEKDNVEDTDSSSDDAEPATTSAPSTQTGKTPQEILAMLRNRNKQ